MSLNDPRWGRGSEEPPENEKDRRADGADEADDRQERNDRNARDDGRNDRHARTDRDGGDGNGPEDDLDQLWERFREMMGSIMGERQPKRGGRRDPLSQLKSRDDFSRDDEDLFGNASSA